MDNFINDFGDVFWKKFNKNNYDMIVFLCIGTDRVIGDCFGPIVGEKLKVMFSRNMNKIKIMGDLNNPICVGNINKALNEINEEFVNPLIIAIDAALDSKNNIGKISVMDEKLSIGTGLNKKKIEVGEISVKGIVNYNTNVPKYNFRLLQNTSLGLINKMAEETSIGIYKAIND